MKKLLLLSVLGLFACTKPVIKVSSTVGMYKNGYKYHYYHNGTSVDTNVFIAQSGDSVRLYSAMASPTIHYAYLVVNNDTVLSHNGFQDTCNLFYIIP